MSIINNINVNLFDHQIRTFGLDGLTKIFSSSVLIYGLDKGLATEIGKNLTLNGIKNLYLYDNNIINKEDIETGYLYSENNIGEIRSLVLMNKLQKLNHNTIVQSIDDYKLNQQVTIVINQSVEVVKKISDYCRSENIKLIVLWSKGVSGVIFVDVGNNHLVIDKTCENIKPVQIEQINETGIIQCVTNSTHEFQTGDTIKFSNLDGENLEQFEKEWLITVINKNSFQLDEFKLIKPFIFINGTVNHIKKPFEINHNPLDLNVSELNNDLIKTYIQMYSNNLINKMPKLWTTENNQFMLEHNICLPNHAKLFHYELIPIVSIFGSITTSEVIKLVTNKNIPISQWFSWSDESLIPKYQNDHSCKSTYGLFYGLELENKLINSNWLIVGSGTLGCEHLKNLAFMNVNNIIITDHELVEKSNLNQQFLFKNEHIGKYKSEIASNMIKQFKPTLNIISNINKVGLDNTDFTDLNLNKVTGIFNAVNNINTRKFMNEQCFKNNLPLFDSGIMGTKGNILPVIPFVSEYSSTLNDYTPENSYPLCVIKSFPNNINHTIQWSLDQFEFYSRAPNTINNWLLDSSYLNTLEENDKTIAKEDVNLFTVKYPTQLNGLSSCVLWAVDMFNDYFYESINKLLESFPPNHDIAGVPFWSAGKRCPKPIKFDYTNQQHLEFIETTVHLLAMCSGIADNFKKSDIYKILDSSSEEPLENKQFKPIYVSQQFETNNDWHVKWITIVSNMRANNYSIPNIDYFQTKGIVGKIIPTIITTSSIISGLSILEMLKYLMGFKEIDKYKLLTVNLADLSIIKSEPLVKASMIDIAGVKVNSWTKFEYNKDTTLNEFKIYYEKIFETVISMIVIDTTMIYADFLDSDKLDQNLSKILCDHFDTNIIPKNISFNLLSNDDKEIPIISVNI